MSNTHRLSIADAWDETAAFARREGGLLLPVAFATMGVGQLLIGLATPDTQASQIPVSGPWMLALVPFVLLWMFGQLSVAALALHGGISVADALRTAARRTPAAIGAMALVGVAMLLLMVLLSFVGLTMAAADPTRGSALATVLALPVVAVLSVRLLTLFPVLVDREPRPVAALRAAFANSRGAFWRLFGASILYFLTVSLIVGAVRLGLGSVLLLAGRQFGAGEGARVIVLVLTALLCAGLQSLWCVFTVSLYRRLGSASSGI